MIPNIGPASKSFPSKQNESLPPPVFPSNEEKKDLFERLVHAINAIPGMQPIDLSSRKFDVRKDAIAFLVEHCPLPEKEQWRAVLERLLSNLGHVDLKNATYLLDESIQLAVQAAVSHKIEKFRDSPDLPDGQIEMHKWETWLKMYTTLSDYNKKVQQESKPVFFGGVPRELLPQWYLSC